MTLLLFADAKQLIIRKRVLIQQQLKQITMRKALLIMMLIVSTGCIAQFSVNAGIDPKLLIFGANNEYTTHDSKINIDVKIEYRGRDNDLYFAIGAEYANLREEYRSWFADFGIPINFTILNIDLLFIPQLEIGDIFREHIKIGEYDSIKWDDTYYYGVNIPFRYFITDVFAVELEGSVDRATDLPKREWRYGGKVHIIFYL
jgi:hypothetical protein